MEKASNQVITGELKTRLQKVDALRYHSKAFSVTVEYDGSNYFISVYDELSKEVIDMSKKATLSGAEIKFNSKVEEYIFDWQKKLQASK